MKLLKKLLPVAALLLSGSLFAQEVDMSRNVIVPGQAGKMIIFKSMPGVMEVYLSRNGKFLMGRSDEDNFGFIYEIATEKIETYNGSVIGVIDWNNYVTSTYAKIGGEEYTKYVNVVPAEMHFSIEDASADLLTLRAGCNITRPGADFGNIFIDTKTGKILDTLKDLDPTYPLGGKMNMGLGMSDDTRIVVGRGSLTGTMMNYSPAFWDREKDTVYFTGYDYIVDGGRRVFTPGGMYAVSKVNGSETKVRICGEIRERACYFEYDLNEGTFTEPTYIDRSPGLEVSYAFKMNQKGVILGTEQASTVDIYSRVPFIYFTENNQKYKLADYLQYLYGLDGEQELPLFTQTGISEDNRLISGYSQDVEGDWYAYLIVLDEHQIYAPVRNVQVKNTPLRSLNAEVSWEAPMQGEYTLTGYNVFRGNKKLNGDQPLPVDKLSYKDTVLASGKYKYFVQAVYGDKVSEAPDTVSIFLIDPTGCLPVQEIFSDVEYNRTVSLYWGLPSERESSNIINRPKGNASKYLPEDELDFVSLFQPVASRMSAGIRVGDYIYAGSYESGNIYVFDLSGNIIKEIYVDGMSNIYDMTYYDGLLYVATARDRVEKLNLSPRDPFKITSADHFTTNFNRVVSITCVENSDPDINGGNPYLLLGDYYNLAAYQIDAVNEDDQFTLPVSLNTQGMVISGIEYYDGRLYVANQEGTDGCDVVAYDMTTGDKLFTTNLYKHPSVKDAAMGAGILQPVFSGGLTHATLADGTVVLECLVQCQNSYNMLVDMELESSSDVLGYVVYRNDEKITDTLKARHYTDIIDEAGKYTYYIEYLSTRGCKSSSKDFATTEEEIFDKGDCSAPQKLEVFESNKSAVLTWSLDGLDEKFVGFNLYRNGEQIGEKNFFKLQYTDPDVELDTKYTYVLEAFYDNSCLASDTVSITLNNKGAAREPSAFKVKGNLKDDNTVDATATWGLPYFEEPMAYGYCGIPAGGNSLEGVSQLFCIIGWDKTDMNKFNEDLYLVGVEFVLASSYGYPNSLLRSLSAVVYVNDELVYTQPYDGRRIPAREWGRMYFSKVFKMKQEQEIAVGYTVSYDPDEMVASDQAVFAFDMGPRTKGKSDLISYDGRSFSSLYVLSSGGFDVNLCINALVVRSRDLEAAAMAADPQEYLMTKVMRMDLDARLGETKQLTDAPKTSSEGIKLLGFNIYRDGEMLNENIMTEFEYKENVPFIDDEYEYVVGAVYENAEELRDTLYVNFKQVGVEELQQAYQVSVYPNPASDVLNIKGEYVSFSMVDMNGRMVMRDVRNTESVSLAGLNDGVYFVLITLPNGDKRSVKIIKR